MHLKAILLLLIFTGALNACSRTALRDCQMTDWFSLGQRDGLVGAPAEVFETYSAACRETGITPDRDAYQNGHQDGLRYYCTDPTGFKVGRGHKPYHHVCPPALEKDFLRGHARGLRLQGCRAEIYVYEEHLTSLERALRSKSQALDAPQTPPAAKARLRREIKSLETFYRQAGDDLAAAESRCMAQW